MAQERLSMRKIKEVLRLKYDSGLSQRQIAASCDIATSTVADYLKRAHAAGISWPLPAELTDETLEARLASALPPKSTSLPSPGRAMPDFAHIHDELRAPRKVNL